MPRHHAESRLPEDYDVMYLGYGGERGRAERGGAFRYIHRPRFPLVTHAMVISQRGLRKLLGIITEIDDHIDWKIARNAKKLEIYACNKQVVKKLWEDSNNSHLRTKAFPVIINHYLDKIQDANGVPKSYGYNFQVYKHKDYVITRITYFVFDAGILSNMHAGILLLCVLYFSCNYDRFHAMVFSSGYLMGSIWKWALTCCVVSQHTVCLSYKVLGVFLYLLNFPFTLIRTLL